MQDVTYVHPVTALGKRAMDISIAVTGIILTLPLYPFIALAIKLNNPGPVFYRQMRIGYQRENYVRFFLMTRFRTMSTDAKINSSSGWTTNAHGKTKTFFTTKKAPQLTQVGSLLCKTRLDKLPLFWNVLMGDMSIVGPRPERPGMYHTLENTPPFYTERTLDVVPGMTGLAQVNPSDDETIDDGRNHIAYDHTYALALSSPVDWLKMDFTIMLKTLWGMVTGKGQRPSG